MARKTIRITTEPELHKRKNGYSFRYRIPAHGTQPMTKSPWQKAQGKKKGEVLQEAEVYRQQLEDEINDFTRRTDMTFGEYAWSWHQGRVDLQEATVGTLEREEHFLKAIDESKLAKIPMDELESEDIDEFKKENAKKGYSTDKQRKLLMLVKQILKFATARRNIKHDPSDGVTSIKREIKDKRRALTQEQQIKLRQDLESEPVDGRRVVIMLAFMTGMRRGECLGLQWGDIDLDERTIELQRQLTSKGEYADPKFGSSGTIPMGETLARYLRQWKEATSERYYEGKPVPNGSPVCRNENGEQLQAASFDKWRRAWFVAHGLGEFTKREEFWDSKGRKRYHNRGYKGFRLHELRHTMATELVANADLKTAQTILRHTHIGTTAGYIHKIDENVRTAADALDQKRALDEVKEEKSIATKDEQGFGSELNLEHIERAYKRQKGKCKICGKKVKRPLDGELDFITPLSKGGKRTSSNIQFICKECDFKKDRENAERIRHGRSKQRQKIEG